MLNHYKLAIYRKGSPQLLLALTTLLCVSLSCSLAYKQARNGPNSDGSKMREVKAVFAHLPTYPEFSLLEEHEVVSTGTIASISVIYQATAEYEKVKQFYVTELSKQGWQLVRERNLASWGQDYGERELSFRKEAYEIVISYAGERQTGWQYAIDISWKYA